MLSYKITGRILLKLLIVSYRDGLARFVFSFILIRMKQRILRTCYLNVITIASMSRNAEGLLPHDITDYLTYITLYNMKGFNLKRNK